jgi:fucose permease
MATSLVMIASSTCGGGVMPYLLGLSGDLISFRFGISVLGVFVVLSSLLLLRKLE